MLPNSKNKQRKKNNTNRPCLGICTAEKKKLFDKFWKPHIYNTVYQATLDERHIISEYTLGDIKHYTHCTWVNGSRRRVGK